MVPSLQLSGQLGRSLHRADRKYRLPLYRCGRRTLPQARTETAGNSLLFIRRCTEQDCAQPIPWLQACGTDEYLSPAYIIGAGFAMASICRAVAQLRGLGLRTLSAHWRNSFAAQSVADRVGIGKVVTGFLPED